MSAKTDKATDASIDAIENLLDAARPLLALRQVLCELSADDAKKFWEENVERRACLEGKLLDAASAAIEADLALADAFEAEKAVKSISTPSTGAIQ